MDDRLSNLHPNMVKAIICTKDSVTTEFKLQNCVVDDIFEDFKNLNVEDE